MEPTRKVAGCLRKTKRKTIPMKQGKNVNAGMTYGERAI
jgi:hypothetical protein